MLLDDEFRNVEDLINLCYAQTRVDVKLQIVFNICQILGEQEWDKSFTKDIKQMSKFVQNLLLDNKFRRAIHRRSALIDREPIIYFGDDTPKGDMYDYDETLENDITHIEFAITRFLGTTLKNLQGMRMI